MTSLSSFSALASLPGDERVRSAADAALLQRLQQQEEQTFPSSLSSLFYKWAIVYEIHCDRSDPWIT
jgi:hypothetical protein